MRMIEEEGGPIRTLHLVLRGIAILALGTAGVAAGSGHADYAPGEILVRYTAEGSAQHIHEIERRHGLERLHEIPHLRLVGYRIPGSVTVDEMVSRLEGLAEIEYVEANPLRRPQALPDDPLFPQQWSLRNTGQRVNGRIGPSGVDIAWEGARQRFAGRAPVTVAVIDTGVALQHPELVPVLWRNAGEVPGNGIDDDANGFIDDVHGWDFFDEDADPSDENGHGTLVASQIAAPADNGVGIAGVAPTARIMALRILDDFGFSRPATALDLIRATTYAAENGARIVNLSLGGGAFSRSELDQFVWLDARGVLASVAAGNGGSDGLGDDNDAVPVYPASYDVPNIVSVAALDRSGRLASFSNFGAGSVDLAAPGIDVIGAGLAREVVFVEDFEDFDRVATSWSTFQFCRACPPWAIYEDDFGNAWATDSFGTDAQPFAFYQPLTDSWLLSPWIRLPEVGPRLDFRAWWELAAFSDIAGVAVSMAPGDPPPATSFELLGAVVGTASSLPPEAGASAGTVLAGDLSPYAGQDVRLRFRIFSDDVFEADGIYIDDVVVSGVAGGSSGEVPFQTLSGTSFAAPLVAGVAALMMSQQPSLTHRQVVERMLAAARPVPLLAGRVRTGGRLDAEQALVLVPEPAPLALATVGLATLAGLAGRRSALRKRLSSADPTP